MPELKSNDPTNKIPLIGPKYAKKLEGLNIFSVNDFLFHFPFRYSDSRNIIKIQNLVIQEEGTVIAKLSDIINIRTKRGRHITKAEAEDDTGAIEVIWFNQPFLIKTLREGKTYLLKGKTNKKYGQITLSNPEYELYQFDTTHLGKLTPIYPETYGVTSKWIRSRMKFLKPVISSLITDYLPETILKEEDLIDLKEAITKIHFPQSLNDIEISEKRLGLDELIKIQIQAQKIIRQRKKESAKVIKSQIENKKNQRLINSLNFKLTDCQISAIGEILSDISKPEPMERLLNGDVGSGKTIVALVAALSAFENGYTTIFMAPTTILAKQHFETISRFLNTAKIEIPIKLLTSSQKDEISNEPQIIITTHAILYQKEIPKNTALAIVDEEHRFGVKQRKNITHELKGIHRLTMTATPIPRTLTMTIYGEKNVSILDEMPKGRKEGKTHIVPEKKRKQSYDWIKKRLKEKQQLFVIHPLIDSSEKVEAKAAKEEYENIKKEFSNSTVGLAHGRLKEKEKNEQIQNFRDGRTDILVATPIVEVGIDIPNATMMIIENSERFGLAQLHQFRGRIGRNDMQSYCFLFTNSKSKDVIERLDFFSQNPSGFKVAEYDLKRRGPGEVYGTKQSGLLHFRFADILDPKQVKKALIISQKLLKNE